MSLKYLIVNVDFAELVPVVFREDLAHAVPFVGCSPEIVDSAGFVTVEVVWRDGKPGFRCIAWGKSFSLGKKAKVERDSKILTEMFNRNL